MCHIIILVASLILMALFKTEPSELDWLQVYDMTHWWKKFLRTGASLQGHEYSIYRVLPENQKNQHGADLTLVLEKFGNIQDSYCGLYISHQSNILLPNICQFWL